MLIYLPKNSGNSYLLVIVHNAASLNPNNDSAGDM
jgi:hypothetical protein